MSKSNEKQFSVSGWDDDINDYEEEKNPHETPQKEILWAAETGSLEVVKRLIESDRSLLNVVDSDGYTPLHRASYSNHCEIVSYLLESGADVAAKTLMQWQPLHSACQWNNVECALCLIQHGADVNAVTEGGQTPLHLAASHGRCYDVAQLLLIQPYIRPDLKNNSNESAYDIAQRRSKYYNLFDMGMLGLNGVG